MNLDMHTPKPTLQQNLQKFIKNSKAYIKLAGTVSTKQAVQAYKGTELLMSRYGILFRAPAVQSSLCLAPAFNTAIHTMLTNIRRSSKEGQHMLKGSSLPYPKLEPWMDTLGSFLKLRASQGSPSIPSIVQRNLRFVHEDICIRGGG